MLAIIVIVLGALAIVAIAFSSYLSMVSSSGQLMKSLEEKRLINDITSSIQQLMRPLGQDRLLLVPNGQVVDGVDYLLPPRGVNFQTKNGWGRDLMYCPFSLTKESGSDLILAGAGQTYSATLVTDSSGAEYVYSVEQGADPTGTDLVAAIISPLPTETSPSCADIRFDRETGNYFTRNFDGLVHPVVYSSFVVSNQAKSIRPDPDSNSDIAELFSSWASIIPDVTNVVLQPKASAYLTSNLLFINDSQAKSKSVIFRGDSPSTSVINGSSSEIVFENVTVHLSNMSFADGLHVRFINSDVTLDNVSVRNISIDSSNVFLRGQTSLYSGSDPIIINNSNIRGSSANLSIYKSGNVGAQLSGSMVSVNSISFNNLTPNGVGMVVGNSSSLIVGQSVASSGSYLDNIFGIASGGLFNNSNISVNISNPVDTFLFNQGNVYLDNVSISFNSDVIRGIILGLNSDTILNQVQLGSSGNQPSVGVEDVGGAKFVGGEGTLIYATSECWSGTIFERPASSFPGGGSQTRVRDTNLSAWQCNF